MTINADFYRSFIENAQDMFYRMSLHDGAYVYVNPASESVTGYTPDEFYASPLLIRRLMHSDFHDYFNAEWKKLVAGDPSPIYEYKIIDKSGKIKWINQRNTLVCDDSGTPTFFEGILTDITEHKKTSKELDRTKSILETAFEQSSVGITIAEAPDGKISYINNAGLLISGGERNSIFEKVDINDYLKTWELLDLNGQPLDAEEVPLTRAIRYGETYSREMIVHRKEQDDDRILTVTASPIKDNDKVISAIVVYKDITDKKNVELKVKNLADRLLLATSSAQLGVWDWNVRDNIMVWDDRMFELYGVTREEVPNTFDAWKNGLHPEDKEAAIASCQAALKGETEFDTEFRVLHPNGTVIHIKANGMVITGNDGTPERMLGVNADVTEQRQMHEKVLEMERQNRVLLDYSPVCHKIIDLDFNLRYMNRNGFCMLKLDPNADVYGKPYPFDFFPEPHKKEILEGLHKVLETGEKVSFESMACDVEGNEVWLNHNLIPVPAEDGTISFLTIVSADITKRKRLELMQLQSSQLAAIGEVAAGVAHEINNPINGIINYAELLLHKDPEDNFTKNILQSIVGEGDRVAAIVRNLLDFSHQGDEGKIFVDPASLFVEPLNLMIQFFKNEGIHIDIGFEDSLPEVFCNKRQIEQVILNILSNARHALNEKYHRDNHCKYLIVEAKDIEEKNHVQLSIQDMGTGIPEENLKHIFDTFFTTKKAGVGTGLGLSLCKNILEDNGGDISIESKFGQFTKVILTLPKTES